MGAAQHLTGLTFEGTKKVPSAGGPSRWTVAERLTLQDDLTPGQFSVGYRVQDQGGRQAFMKVSDLDLLTGDEVDILQRITVAAGAHKFERSILDHCRGSNMDRIVTAIDYGSCRVDVDGDVDV